eukprot:COSAG04_NODE_3820_length_2496_cov_1.697121_2_plen_100_part_00
MRRIQQGSGLLLDRAIFAQLVAELGRKVGIVVMGKGYFTPFFTREAIEALQVVAEDFLIRTYWESTIAMRSQHKPEGRDGNRQAIFHEDITLALAKRQV